MRPFFATAERLWRRRAAESEVTPRRRELEDFRGKLKGCLRSVTTQKEIRGCSDAGLVLLAEEAKGDNVERIGRFYAVTGDRRHGRCELTSTVSMPRSLYCRFWCVFFLLVLFPRELSQREVQRASNVGSVVCITRKKKRKRRRKKRRRSLSSSRMWSDVIII